MYYSIETMGSNIYASRPGIDYLDIVANLKPHSNPITIGKNVVAGFTEVVSKKDALYNRATISALDLDSLDVAALKRITDALIKGLSNPESRHRYLTALEKTLESSICFQPIGRNRILTIYSFRSIKSLLCSHEIV
jgi:hypothetical protein